MMTITGAAKEIEDFKEFLEMHISNNCIFDDEDCEINCREYLQKKIKFIKED